MRDQLFGILWVCLAVNGRVGAETGWGLTDLGALAPTAGFTVPTDMNNLGQVVGASHVFDAGEITLAFVWTRGQMRVVPEPPGADYVQARAINDAGQIAGDGTGYDDITVPYRWLGDQAEFLGTLRDGPQALAWGINRHGHVAGQSLIEPGFFATTHAFVWDGELHELFPVTGVDEHNCEGRDINDYGVVVGASSVMVGEQRVLGAAVWIDGVGSALGMLRGDLTSWAVRVNNAGTAVGISSYSNRQFAVMWRQGQIILLTPTSSGIPGTFRESVVYDVNDYDEAVGSGTIYPMASRSFIWREGVLTYTTSLVPPDFEWRLSPRAINNAGQLACNGVYVWDPSGAPQRSFILTPPECRGFPRGDANCDGDINNFDIDAFVMALADVDAYAANFAACNWLCNLDINRDGSVNNFDIDPFVELLVSQP
ncbi:MAG: hypothetical protein AB7Q17_18170 [Phycisphaerae bacterium]